MFEEYNEIYSKTEFELKYFQKSSLSLAQN